MGLFFAMILQHKLDYNNTNMELIYGSPYFPLVDSCGITATVKSCQWGTNMNSCLCPLSSSNSHIPPSTSICQVGEIEEQLAAARREVTKSEEANQKLQRDVKEVGMSQLFLCL